MDTPRIIKTEPLPSTTNAWGFGGATDKMKHTMSNGDVWVSGKAHYRHTPSEKYIQLKRNSPDFTGGLHAEHDVLLRGSAVKYIEKFYLKLEEKY